MEAVLSDPFLILAPLHGITNRLFRLVYAAHFSGFDAAVAPFIVASAGRVQSDKLYRDLAGRVSEAGREPEAGAESRQLAVIPQLLSNDGAAMLEAAGRLGDYGYSKLDWNLGCPYSRVAHKKRGSGLLPYPDLVKRILDEYFAGGGPALSVKLRLGYRQRDEIMALLPLLNEYPLSAVTIHPRLGVQLYDGTVDLEAFEEAAGLCRHPLVYNGDIRTLEDFLLLKTRFPFIKRWMLGRGALANPFLAEAIRSSALAGGTVDVEGSAARRQEEQDVLRRLRDFHEALFAAYSQALCGPGHLLGKMKELWGYWGPCFPDQDQQLKALRRTSSVEEFRRLASKVLTSGAYYCRGMMNSSPEM